MELAKVAVAVLWLLSLSSLRAGLASIVPLQEQSLSRMALVANKSLLTLSSMAVVVAVISS